jgi:hypothetical protein
MAHYDAHIREALAPLVPDERRTVVAMLQGLRDKYAGDDHDRVDNAAAAVFAVGAAMAAEANASEREAFRGITRNMRPRGGREAD